MEVLKEVHPSRLKIGDKLFKLVTRPNLDVRKVEVVLYRHFNGSFEWSTQDLETEEVEHHYYDSHTYGKSDSESCMKVKLPTMYRQNPIKKVKKW